MNAGQAAHAAVVGVRCASVVVPRHDLQHPRRVAAPYDLVCASFAPSHAPAIPIPFLQLPAWHAAAVHASCGDHAALRCQPPLPPPPCAHQVFLGYILVSGLTGLALTYWYNNPNNAKVRNPNNVELGQGVGWGQGQNRMTQCRPGQRAPHARLAWRLFPPPPPPSPSQSSGYTACLYKGAHAADCSLTAPHPPLFPPNTSPAAP